MEVEAETVAVDEEEIRERILREREAAEAERLAHEQELEAESKQLDEEIAQEIRGTHGFTWCLPGSVGVNCVQR